MLRLALCQCAPPGQDPKDTLAFIAARLEEARAGGAKMLLFPELLLPGYNRPALHGGVAQPQDGPWMRRLSELAQDHGCGVTLGWAERDGDHVYNAASCIDDAGHMLAHYRKLQLYGEMEHDSFVPGDRHAVFELNGLRCGLLICYDVEFPEQVRALAARGVQLLLVPTANPAGFAHVQDLLIPARAVENAMTVAYANFTGDDAGVIFEGGSVIAGPDGAVLARAGSAPALLFAEVPEPGPGGDPGLATRVADLRLPRVT